MNQRPLTQKMIMCLTAILFGLGLGTTTGFSTTTTLQIVSHSWHASAASLSTSSKLHSSSTDEAAALTEFMARAHEEKIAALGRVESKYREQILELQEQVAELESQVRKTTPTSGNSFAFPATNKVLTEKVEAYRAFLSDYIVKSTEEKYKAVKSTEEKYKAIIADLKKE